MVVILMADQVWETLKYNFGNYKKLNLNIAAYHDQGLGPVSRKTR